MAVGFALFFFSIPPLIIFPLGVERAAATAQA